MKVNVTIVRIIKTDSQAQKTLIEPFSPNILSNEKPLRMLIPHPDHSRQIM